jgi:post-segregation antitoxin (ccd killing protein)
MDGTPKATRHLELEIDADLVARAERLSPDLSATVTGLLARHVERLERTPPTQAQIDALVAASNAFIEEHGFWGEEFSTL